MSVKITIPGADFSSSGLPKFEKTIAGFPVNNLKGLYLFEDGINGDSIASAVDSSGLGNHASLATGGSSGVKGASGLVGTNFANPAVFSAPGLDLGQAFTVVVAAKVDADVDSYPWFWRASSDIGSGLGNTQANGEAINIDCSNSSLRAQYYNFAGYMDNGVTSSNTSISLIKAGAVPTDWFAAAFSFNPAQNRFRFYALDQYSERVSATPAAASAAKTGTHLFGVGRWGNSSIAQTGKLGLFGLYSGEKTQNELAALISKARTRMLARGITVY